MNIDVLMGPRAHLFDTRYTITSCIVYQTAMYLPELNWILEEKKTDFHGILALITFRNDDTP